MSEEDQTTEMLLLLDDTRYVIDEDLGLWVNFKAKKVMPTADRPHGVRYSLTLHDRKNERIMGFDNAHAVEYGGKKNVAPKRIFDHWHRNEKDSGYPYPYTTAGKLVEDFWKEVDRVLKNWQGDRK